MPAEWEPHVATWLAWPHNQEDWPGKFAAIPWVYGEIIRHLCRSERVFLLVPPASTTHLDVLEELGLDRRVAVIEVPTDRVWTRDYGPSFVKAPDGTLIATDWHFNGWAKYANWKYDDAVNEALAEGEFHWPRYQPTVNGRRVVLEGGSIDVNGAGLLLTTEECLLSPVQARNPGLKKEDLERVFAEVLGIRKVLWLGRGIVGDDTHGHIDDLARFVGPRTVVTVVEHDPRDANHEPLRENLERLRGMTDLDGNPLEIVTLPMPGPVLFSGQRLPASYANFYIANRVVLVPTFNDPHDRQALNTLAELFPDRTVVGIHAVDLVWGLGTLHCLTQQQPGEIT
jgi:agmatine deiminase